MYQKRVSFIGAKLDDKGIPEGVEVYSVTLAYHTMEDTVGTVSIAIQELHRQGHNFDGVETVLPVTESMREEINQEFKKRSEALLAQRMGLN